MHKYSIVKMLSITWNERKKTPLRVVKKSYARYKKHGKSGMVYRLNKEYYSLYPHKSEKKKHSKDVYKKWIEENEKDILQTKELSYTPLVSIITPTYNTDKKYLVKMLNSVLAQTYGNWELCIADDASTNKETLSILKEYAAKHKNINVVYRKENGHISKASNAALKLASGEYAAFLDHDDTLAPNALYEMLKKLNENRNLKLIYSDEDKIDENDNRYNPHFKSGWNPDMFFSQNYICHFLLMKTDLVETIDGFREGYEGSQDYDLILRSLNHIDNAQIDRVEKILYHWRAIKGSTALSVNEKDYAHAAGLKALQDYFSKKDPNIKVEDGLLPNTYKVNYPLPEVQPLVSILIPTRDGYDILSKCVHSIQKNTLYKNFEIIILDNETTCERTLAYFKALEMHENIRILEYHKPFNYSAINNFGVQHARGEIIALLNNDVEVISHHWLTEMVEHALRPDIGAVGAKLYYDNDTIQHAGVILGIGGVAGHSHKYFHKDAFGYFSRLQIIQNFSAVTAACLVVKKELYEEVGGLDEDNLSVAFNDVDFCLKLLEKGYRQLWTPYVKLYHHESRSRGPEDNPEKLKRFNEEISYMKSKWLIHMKVDSKYNINLSNTHEDFSLREGKIDVF